MVNVKNKAFPIEKITEITNSYLNSKKYDFVYISVGSKYVCEMSTFAKYQMIPEFLLQNNNQNILIIIIDKFTNKDNYKDNDDLLENRKFLTNNKFDILIFNGYFVYFDYITKKLNKNKDELLSFFKLEKLLQQDYHPENVLICNFAKFKSACSLYETYIQKALSNDIYINLNDKFKNCLYEWCGYSKKEIIKIYNPDLQKKINYTK